MRPAMRDIEKSHSIYFLTRNRYVGAESAVKSGRGGLSQLARLPKSSSSLQHRQRRLTTKLGDSIARAT